LKLTVEIATILDLNLISVFDSIYRAFNVTEDLTAENSYGGLCL